MESVIQGYEPKSLFTYFEQISAIPRGSGDEGRIADFLCDFAREHGIDCVKDAYNNVFMTKPATPGYEEKDAILLQGHTDMVCEKENGSSHDFTTDPLELMVKDGMLTARGTTLGGDDGLAVAMMMALLTEDLPHPRLECLFTSDEERGMTGAQNFDYSKVTATELINLDSEEEGIATVSCAGGARIRLQLPYTPVPIPRTDGLLSVSVSGLSGGHSGAEIHMGKSNATELLGRLLLTAYESHPFQILSIQGGSKENAIARDASALIYTSSPAAFRATSAECEKIFRAEAVKSDRSLRIHVRKQSDYEDMRALSFVDTARILDVIALAPTGPITYAPSDRTLVESSCNLGVVTTEPDRVILTYLGRSSVETRMDQMILRYSRLAKRVGARMSIHDRYPGWEYRAESPLRDRFLAIAKEELGHSRACAIHAGLECGYILSAVDHPLDAISIGPDMRDIHTPTETLDLASCERVWKIVCRLIAE